MQSFTDWLLSRSIDQQDLAPELRAALVAQWIRETMPTEPPATRIVIGDGADERWQRAVRV